MNEKKKKKNASDRLNLRPLRDDMKHQEDMGCLVVSMVATLIILMAFLLESLIIFTMKHCL